MIGGELLPYSSGDGPLSADSGHSSDLKSIGQVPTEAVLENLTGAVHYSRRDSRRGGPPWRL